MTDEQLDKLFLDAAKRYTPPSAPEGAWERFLEKQKEAQLQMGSEDLEVAEQANKRKNIYWITAVRRGQLRIAGILIFCLGCLGLWYVLKENRSDLKQTKKIVIKSPPDLFERPSGNAHWPKDSMGAISRNKEDKNKGKAYFDQHIILYASRPIQGSIMASGLKDMEIEKAGLSIKVHFEDLWKKQVGLRPDGLNVRKDSIYNRLSKAEFLAAKGPTLEGKSKDLKRFQNYRNMANIEKKVEKKQHGKWQLGFLVGPNLTTINGSVGKTAGFNTGLVVQRRIKDSKFSLGSGFVLESMVYKMSPDEFHPGGKNLDIPSLTSVSGKCQMLDIPLNVRYDVVRSKKNNAFVSTGISGLLMTKETYSYNYNKQGQAYQRRVDVSGRGKSLYTVTNLSIGYERKFNRTSIQVEPYIKLPMSTIGYGNLNLGSLGTQISIKHNF